MYDLPRPVVRDALYYLIRYQSYYVDPGASVVIVAARAYTSTNVGLMLGQRPRRWPNIKPAFVQCLVFTGRRV